jgi:hypothetical protein
MISNTFPLEYLPKHLAKIIEELNSCMGYPKEFTACSMLFATSVAIGNNFKIQVLPDFQTSASIFLVLVGPAGASKSPPLSFAVKPIEEIDKEAHRAFMDEYKNYLAIKKLSEKEREENAAMNFDEPKCNQLLVNDATMEALFDILIDNPKGVGIYVDEWRDWYLNLNRYNKGENKTKWLQLWDGKDIVLNRKNTIVSRVNNPFGSLAGTTQTNLLNDLFNDENAFSGFLDRFLICNPQELRRTKRNENFNPIHKENWAKYVRNVLSLNQGLDEFGRVATRVLRYAQECKSELEKHEENITNAINHYQNKNPSKAQYLSKVDTYTHRFALIFQVMAHILEGEELHQISITAFIRAKKTMEYFQRNMFELIDKEQLKTLKRICKTTEKYDWYTSLEEQFRTHEAKELLQGILEVSASESISNDAIDKKTIRWLNDDILFEKLSQGLYRKKF